MEVRHGALSTANKNEVIIASAISSLSSCQIKAIHYHHQQNINIMMHNHSMHGRHKKQLSFLMTDFVNLCFNMS